MNYHFFSILTWHKCSFKVVALRKIFKQIRSGRGCPVLCRRYVSFWKQNWKDYLMHLSRTTKKFWILPSTTLLRCFFCGVAASSSFWHSALWSGSWSKFRHLFSGSAGLSGWTEKNSHMLNIAVINKLITEYFCNLNIFHNEGYCILKHAIAFLLFSNEMRQCWFDVRNATRSWVLLPTSPGTW